MQAIKNFWRSLWEVVVEVQTARAAEHLARCGRYAEVRDIYVRSDASNQVQ